MQRLTYAALDPDLAELLSPNKMNGKSQISTPVRSRLPARLHARSPSHSFAPTPVFLVWESFRSTGVTQRHTVVANEKKS
jgi:hypothetical protein